MTIVKIGDHTIAHLDEMYLEISPVFHAVPPSIRLGGTYADMRSSAGRELDALGRVRALYRGPLEPDSDFRNRIMATIVTGETGYALLKPASEVEHIVLPASDEHVVLIDGERVLVTGDEQHATDIADKLATMAGYMADDCPTEPPKLPSQPPADVMGTMEAVRSALEANLSGIVNHQNTPVLLNQIRAIVQQTLFETLPAGIKGRVEVGGLSTNQSNLEITLIESAPYEINVRFD